MAFILVHDRCFMHCIINSTDSMILLLFAFSFIYPIYNKYFCRIKYRFMFSVKDLQMILDNKSDYDKIGYC